MAKTIKFNLICDDKPVRTIEDLQNNFSIEDVLEYYKNQRLHKWLEVRGYREELEKVRAVTAEKPVEIMKELIRIFHVSEDEKEIEESVSMLEYWEERKKIRSVYKKTDCRNGNSVEAYRNGYNNLIKRILKNPDNIAVIKADIDELASNYKWILELDHRNLFYMLEKKSPLAVMCLLMNQKLRNYFLPREETNAGLGSVSKTIINKPDGGFCFWGLSGKREAVHSTVTVGDTQAKQDKEDMYRAICSMTKTDDFKAQLGKNLLRFDGATHAWKKIQSKGKKYMIISIGDGDSVRPAGEIYQTLDYTKIENKFVIIDGIEYWSNYAFHHLEYMEVSE